MGRKLESYIKKSSSALEDFKEFQIPKIIQICFLALGILFGVGIAAFIKSSFRNPVEDIGEEFVEDDIEVLDTAIPRLPVQEKAKEKEKERKPPAGVKLVRVPAVPVRGSKTERKAVERSTARPALVAQKPAAAKVFLYPTKEVQPRETIETKVADELEKILEKRDAIPLAKPEMEREADPDPEVVAPKKAEPAVKHAQPNNLKSRLEEAEEEKPSDEEESESSIGGSFQDRLRKSTR